MACYKSGEIDDDDDNWDMTANLQASDWYCARPVRWLKIGYGRVVVGDWNNKAFVHAPFDFVQEWISGLFEVSVETPASPGGSSHESSEQGLRSSIHEQERDEIERQQEWISSFFKVSVEAPTSRGGGSHESSEQGLRSSIQEQERNEIKFDER
ncbi:hypothetical protein WN943_023397 [Citrus x changshan-huyou]